MSLKDLATETLALLQAGRYTATSGHCVEIDDALRRSSLATRLYTPSQLEALTQRRTRPAEPDARPPARVAVTDETTQVAARRLAAEHGNIVLLNFASARNHGGGFLNGAKAQEEDLCRCSGLYPTLLEPSVQPYYEANRAQRSLLYTDHAIYSPDVPWFRVSGHGELLDEPFTAAVITMPAPNAGPILRQDPSAGPVIAAAFQRRWGQVLAIAEDRGHRCVLLGAWGCGAFGNDPEVAANAVLPWLSAPRFLGVFDAIVFAIPNRGDRGSENHEAFARVLRIAG